MRGFDFRQETANGRPAPARTGHRAAAAAVFLAGSLVLATMSSPADAITKTEKTFKGWTVTCVEDDESQRKRCSMQQSLIRSQDRQLVFSWTIRRNQKGELVQAVAVPTGVSIKEGVRLFLGDSDPQTLGYDICGPRVCFAQVPFTEELVSAARGSSKASANYVRGNKQLMQVDLDLDGFAAAYDFFIEQLSS